MRRTKEEEEEANTVIAISETEMDCGYIDSDAAKAANVPSGPIRLYVGYPGKTGWGLRHVESTPGRCKDIERLGHSNPLAFACFVGSNWETLHDGPAGPKPRIAVALKAGNDQPAIALQWNGRAWSIVTMLPFRQVNYPILYKKPTA